MSDDAIGTIELGSSTRLIFSISRWNGRQYAHIRKHVATERYSGPTKSGLMLAGDIAVALIDGLQRLKAEVPGPVQREFARLAKREDTQVVITLVPPDTLERLPSVDVREYVDTAKYKGDFRLLCGSLA